MMIVPDLVIAVFAAVMTAYMVFHAGTVRGFLRMLRRGRDSVAAERRGAFGRAATVLVVAGIGGSLCGVVIMILSVAMVASGFDAFKHPWYYFAYVGAANRRAVLSPLGGMLLTGASCARTHVAGTSLVCMTCLSVSRQWCWLTPTSKAHTGGGETCAAPSHPTTNQAYRRWRRAVRTWTRSRCWGTSGAASPTTRLPRTT